jgi:hypothetical protein
MFSMTPQYEAFLKRGCVVILRPLVLLATTMLVACTTPIVEDSDPPDGQTYVRWLPQQFRAPVPATLE